MKYIVWCLLFAGMMPSHSLQAMWGRKKHKREDSNSSMVKAGKKQVFGTTRKSALDEPIAKELNNIKKTDPKKYDRLAQATAPTSNTTTK